MAAIFSNSSIEGSSADVFQAEAEQKLPRGFVEDGAADDLLAAGGGDELAASSEPKTPDESTPRISLTSGAVTGCL